MSNIGRFQNLEESDLRLIMLEPLEVQASTIDARVRKIEAFNRRVFSELGMLVLYVEEKRLFNLLFDEKGERFKSLDSWMQSACPYSVSYAKEAKAKVKILRESGTPLDELLNVPRCNVLLLSQLSSSLQRDPEILKDAQLLQEKVFRDKIIREHPEQGIEPEKKMIFSFEASTRLVIEEAIALAMKKFDCPRQVAVEGIFGEFLVNNRPESNIGRTDEKVVAANA
jgi:hypothetical protein